MGTVEVYENFWSWAVCILHSEMAMNLLGTKSGRLWLKVMYLGIKLGNTALVMVYNDCKFE